MGECKKHWGLPGSHLDYCKWCEPECKHEGATFNRGTYEKGVLTRTATCACGETYTWRGGKHGDLPQWVWDSTMELEEAKEELSEAAKAYRENERMDPPAEEPMTSTGGLPGIRWQQTDEGFLGGSFFMRCPRKFTKRKWWVEERAPEEGGDDG